MMFLYGYLSASEANAHRDLKPDNVMIVSDPEAPGGERAKIRTLVSLSHVADRAMEAAASQTSTGMMVGTPLYMSPSSAKAAATSPTRRMSIRSG